MAVYAPSASDGARVGQVAFLLRFGMLKLAVNCDQLTLKLTLLQVPRSEPGMNIWLWRRFKPQMTEVQGQS